MSEEWRKNAFKARIVCKFCGRMGHYMDECFAKKRQERERGKGGKKGKGGMEEPEEEGNKKRKMK